MKKLLTAISAITLVGTMFSTAAMAKSENAKKSLVALGDSITFGYNLGVNNEQPSKFAFPYIIGQDANLRVRDLGVPGWRTDQLLFSIKNDDAYRDAVRHADYVTLDIGNNDLLQALKASNGDATKLQQSVGAMLPVLLKNLSDTILEIRSLTDVPIVVYNIYNPFQTTDPMYGQGNFLLSNIINKNINSTVNTLKANGVSNLVIADAFSTFYNRQSTYVRQNDIHPTIEGQKKLAEIGEAALNLD
ncbi:GDSL-type esterase/lipase family protein [Gottfriedia acidiceleris]|uniref:GDSL-type esterase/lipase family protein n=1 Tax=Gottfriedia acidiceleris TaxID=371036 RepID=UPI0030004312